MWRCICLCGIAALVACGEDVFSPSEPWALRDGEPATPQPMPEPEPEFHERFHGVWIVSDGVPRGGITADKYQFDPDGTLTLLERFDPAGVVVPCNSGDRACLFADTTTRCEFGASWSSSGATRITIASTCSDGVSRQIEFVLPEDQASNATQPGTFAQLVTVGGSPDWSASGFLGPQTGLFFQRCVVPQRCFYP